MVLEGSVNIQTVPCQESTVIRPYGIPSRTLFSFDHLKPQTFKENPSIHLHPESMWYIFCPPPEPIPYRKLYIPIDPSAPPKPRLPKWLKKDKRTGVPGVLKRALGWLKITSWMLKIADEIIATAVQKFEATGDRINHRKIRRLFRNRVSAVKRQQRYEKRLKRGQQDDTLLIDDTELDPKEWGEGRFDEINKAKAEKRARLEREKQLAAEAAPKVTPTEGPAPVNVPSYKKGTGKFK